MTDYTRRLDNGTIVAGFPRNDSGRRRAEQKPLADQFAELIADLVPKGHIYTGAQRAKFDSLYRELSKIDEKRSSR